MTTSIEILRRADLFHYLKAGSSADQLKSLRPTFDFVSQFREIVHGLDNRPEILSFNAVLPHGEQLSKPFTNLLASPGRISVFTKLDAKHPAGIVGLAPNCYSGGVGASTRKRRQHLVQDIPDRGVRISRFI